MLRTHKSLSVIMALCLCLAFLAPVFVAPPAAQAAAEYQALTVPTLEANAEFPQDLGAIQIDIGNCAAINAGDVLTLTFPSEIDLNGPTVLGGSILPANGGQDLQIVVPGRVSGDLNALDPATSFTKAEVTATKTTLDITFSGEFAIDPVTGSSLATNSGRLLLYFKNVKVGSFDDDITCQILGPAGGAFPAGEVVVGRVSTAGGSLTTIKGVREFGTGGLPFDLATGQMGTDSIIIAEITPGGLVKSDADNILKVKLPNGFVWQRDSGGAGYWAWGFAGNTPGDMMTGTQIYRDTEDFRVLNIKIPREYASSSAGQVRFQWGIVVDDDVVAKEGTVVAHLYDTEGLATETDIEVGKYVSYGAQVEEGTTTELIAGKHNQKLGTFYISENVADSLLGNRSIKLILPAKVKWSGTYEDGMPTIKQKAGNVKLRPFSCSSPYDTLKTTVIAGSTKSKWEFKDFRVDIAPDFFGDLTITVAGDAGVSGEVLVATVKPAVELSADNATNVIIGRQNQELGTLTLKEARKGIVALKSANIDTWQSTGSPAVSKAAGYIFIDLPPGARWEENYFPTVEVTEGDLVLKTDEVAKSSNTRLAIPVKSESSEPSTIEISGMRVTLDRTVPEGEFKVGVSGNAINETGGPDRAFPQFESNKVTVATCVTPAPPEGTVGAAVAQFRIGSNIYQVNGVSKVMDVAPYIKGDRTYVPVRYLGYALGVAEADVLWDEATQKVTLTKGDNVVEMTIGSTTIIVNGEAQAMDVAPEITNDRTMLPARFVAEGLGYEVGWDAGSQTVLLASSF